MPTRLLPKLALTTVAAMALYVPTMGLPLPLNTCLRTIGVATAAPSPTCASDLRECLRQSADLRQTTFGGRYVTAEDVARCMEAFNACIHGGASRGGDQVPTGPSTPTGDTKGSLPQSFKVDYNYDNYTFDCRTSGSAVNCKQGGTAPLAELITDTGEFVGSVSGLTVTGIWTHHSENGSDCVNVMDSAVPLTFVFNLDGTLAIKMGAFEQRHTYQGGCASVIRPNSDAIAATEWTGTWSAIE